MLGGGAEKYKAFDPPAAEEGVEEDEKWYLFERARAESEVVLWLKVIADAHCEKRINLLRFIIFGLVVERSN